MGVNDRKQDERDERKAQAKRAFDERIRKSKQEAERALASIPESARAVLSGDAGYDVCSLSISRRDDGLWRLTIADLSEGVKRVAFSTLSTPAQLFERLAEVVEKADWVESKY